MMVVIAVGVAVPASMLGLPFWAVVGLALAADFGWLVGLRAWPLGRGKALVPITLEDLIRAARDGRWSASESS